MNVAVTAAAATIAGKSTGGLHPTMHTEMVLFHLPFMTACAVGLRANFRVVFRVGTHVAVETLREAVNGFSERIDIGVVTVEAHRRIGAC